MSLSVKECLLRASFYANSADCEGDPEMKTFFRNLAASWKREAAEGIFGRNAVECAEEGRATKPDKIAAVVGF
jgi:hypothetical protein